MTTVYGLGRRKLNSRVENVLNAWRSHYTVTAIAQDLGCSRGHVYDLLRDNKLTARQFRDVPVKQRGKLIDKVIKKLKPKV